MPLINFLQAIDSRSSTLELRHTSTGILSNRPPIVGTPASSGASTPTPDSNATPGSSSTSRLSLLALAKRETARRGLYSRFFRGPILGPDDAQSEMVGTEPSTPATPQISVHHDEPKKSGKRKRKNDADEEGTLKQEREKAERRTEKRLRKEAERRERQDAKNKAKDLTDEDMANFKPEGGLSTSLDQGSGGDIQCVKTKKKKKRRKPTPVDDKLNRNTPTSTDKRALEGENCAKLSKKRRRRDQGL